MIKVEEAVWHVLLLDSYVILNSNSRMCITLAEWKLKQIFRMLNLYHISLHCLLSIEPADKYFDGYLDCQKADILLSVFYKNSLV